MKPNDEREMEINKETIEVMVEWTKARRN